MNSIAVVAEKAGRDTVLDGAYQLALDQFVDDFGAADLALRLDLVAETPVITDGRLAALIAAVVDAVCDETATPKPAWLGTIGTKSPKPFFVMRPNGGCSALFAFMQMTESPPAFFSRNVFVPYNYLSRA